MNHSKPSYVKVTMKELIKISREGKKVNLASSLVNEKKLNSFLNNFEIILSNNRAIPSEDLIALMNSKRKVIKQISADLNISTNELMQKMHAKILSKN